ncbi:zinc finger protein 639 isoform X1 [Callorhinchus milii]|uniref:Zinc finger protein 639 n=1 Tax=Callorhinchus milii TaxID=7868 RepID=V9KIP4_CALMI|nr:zinc finger protein 639 isoform X1 [Callorhinchus milii]|eukprot:gi/632933933/ref/XP_007893517.1/ PREDICTED: zinc finger protein 639 [Callorhinchus milii]
MCENGQRKRRKSLNPSRYPGSDSAVEESDGSIPEHWNNSSDGREFGMTVASVNSVFDGSSKRPCVTGKWSPVAEPESKLNTETIEQEASTPGTCGEDSTPDSSVHEASDRPAKPQCPSTLCRQKWPLRKPSCDGLYCCEHCDFNSRYPLELKQHVILRHPDVQPNVCLVCKQEFLTYSLLHEHLQGHGAEEQEEGELLAQADGMAAAGEDLYWCEQCDLHFCTTSELHLHLQQHGGDEQYLCQFCEHGTEDAAELHAHVLAEHAHSLMEMNDSLEEGLPGPGSYAGKVGFDRRRNFFVCRSCGYRSRLYVNVSRHAAIEHARFFPYVCDDCGKGFCNTAEYHKHLNSHSSQEIYLCQYCDYSTEQIGSLRAHIDTSHAMALPYKCEMCMLRFRSDADLMWHLAKHQQENSLLWYQGYEN